MADDDQRDYDLAGYADVPGYIYGITRAIWEDRGIGGGLAKYYAPDINVRAPSGLTRGNGGVVAQTLATLHQFPDRQLVGEDVIWAATADRGFLSSHRLISVMRHTGDGVLGRAGNARVISRIIADCWVQDGQVKEEWLARDTAAFARCLGTTAHALALLSLEDDARAGRPPQFFTPAGDAASRYTPVIADDPAAALAIAGLQRIWGGKDVAAIRALYFAGATLHAPGGETLHGHGEIDRWVISYLAAFPDARFTIHSATVLREPEAPVRVALRWSIDAAHTGHGHFGPPSGAPVHIMGFTHANITGGRIAGDYTVVDEVAIWKQILAGR
jgi:predicted ester cyclase